MVVDITTIVGPIIPATVGLFGLIWGTHTYKDSQILKRKEILFPLMEEFDKSQPMIVAKKILDDFQTIKRDYSDGDKDWKERDEYYTKSNLERILRDHKIEDIHDNGERRIRESFDYLLAFFSKLEYLLKIHLIKENEIFYFRWYINRAAENEAIVGYVKRYEFQLDGTLHSRLIGYR
jgi:hypothetical protein